MPLSIFESIMRIYRETYPCPIQSFKDIQKYQEVPSCILILISSPYNGTGFFLKFLLCRNIYNIQFAILSILKLQFCGISYIYSALQLLLLISDICTLISMFLGFFTLSVVFYSMMDALLYDFHFCFLHFQFRSDQSLSHV